MHLADEKEGTWMEDHHDKKSQAATQFADGGALRVREELTSLQDIVTQLQEPLKTVTGTDQQSVTLSVRQLESETKRAAGPQLGT
eukprot:2989204-Rhodomonas_salina.1